MKLRSLVALGVVLAMPAVARADRVPATGVVVEQAQADDLLLTPSEQTQGASRLGGTEIMSPPHDSFGVGQTPENPDRTNLRQPRTGAPTIPGDQARANAAAVHEVRRTSAMEAGAIQVLTPEQIAFDAANAQAAGMTAAISQAVTSHNASSGGAAPQDDPACPPALPDQTGAPPDRGDSPADTGAPAITPDSTSTPGPRSTKPDVLPPDATPDDSGTDHRGAPAPPTGKSPSGSPLNARPPAGDVSPRGGDDTD